MEMKQEWDVSTALLEVSLTVLEAHFALLVLQVFLPRHLSN